MSYGSFAVQELSNYEKAEVISKLPFYVGDLEPQDICMKYTQEELNNMYEIGQILKTCPSNMFDY